MALRTPRSDLHPASASRTFTSFVAQIVLADNLEPNLSASPNGAPAAGFNHLPTTLFVVVTGAQVFAWRDAWGNLNSITFSAAGYTGALPFTAATIETATNVTSVTASWLPEA